MSKYLIIFDNHCGACNLSMKLATKLGVIKTESKIALSEYKDNYATCNVDPQRACDEMAVVNKKTQEVYYGVKGYSLLLAEQYPFFYKLSQSELLINILNPLYIFLASNRRIIAPLRTSEAKCNHTLKKKYRFFMIFLLGFFVLLLAFFIVKQQSAAIIERFGKFQSIRHSGLQLKIPLIDRVAGRLSLKIQQLDVIVETKTLDDVFVRLKISVQYKVVKEKVYEAFYKLDYPHEQITSYVFDVVRAEVPKMKLDDVFVKKDDIAIAVKTELNEAMMDYGYDIIKTLVTDIDPDAQVKEAMNRINASEREKIAAQFEGDAARILIVEKAKAEAESKRLQGQGIADQRREIARGLEESVEVLNKVGINSQEASALIVVTQHYDTLQSIGGESNSNLILLPNSPQAGSNMLNDMVASFTASNQIGEAMKNSKTKKDKEE